jgi:hypothetical protein
MMQPAESFRNKDADPKPSHEIACPAFASQACRWRITKIRPPSAFGISLDNASAIDNN